jgi:hypothetical protein
MKADSEKHKEELKCIFASRTYLYHNVCKDWEKYGEEKRETKRRGRRRKKGDEEKRETKEERRRRKRGCEREVMESETG